MKVDFMYSTCFQAMNAPDLRATCVHLLCTAGEGSFVFNERCYHIVNNDLVVIPCPNRVSNLAPHADMQVEWFAADYKFLQSLLPANNMWGKVAPERMPELFNCVDVLVLPSRLEGFPLVTIEALACGANAVAADTVSTAEGIGRDNVFVLDDDFIDNISSRAAEMLARHIDQPLPEACSCAATAKKENEIYQRYLTKLPKNQ